MPNKDIHVPAGRLTGTATAGLLAIEESPAVIGARLLGGFWW